MRLTATEVARNFSDVLNRVAGGEELEVVRNGAPVAMIVPTRKQFLSMGQLRDVLATAPPIDVDFASDLRGLRNGMSTPEAPWPS